MSATVRTLKTFATLVGGLILLDVAVWVPAAVLGLGGAFGVLFLMLVNGWALYAFLRDRQARQDELVQVLAAAVAGGLPLAPAVRSYLTDRPRVGPGRGRAAWALGGLACVALPLYTYARIWIGWHRYDRLLARLATRLEAGESLAAALRAVHGVAAREVRLAAAVGEATGELGPCLRGAGRERWAAAWLELAPRVLYPVVVLVFVSAVATFLMLYIVPRYSRIFAEFGEQLPAVTRVLVATAAEVEDFLPLVVIGAVTALVVLSAVVANPTARWHAPLFGRLYRWGVQAEVLRTLGRLLAVGQTVPQSLRFLGESHDLAPVVRRRLGAATAGVERGDPLDDALGRAGLLPASMRPLVRSAARVRTLPWALGELGEQLAGRAFRLVRRLSLVVAPLLVVAVGGVVGFVALGMFLPLIQLLTRLSE